MTSPRIGACGDNCNECPRYKATQIGSDYELHRVAQLWYDLGLRDRLVSTGEIECNGCNSGNVCAYQEQRNCAFRRNFQNCGYCRDYPCSIVENTLHISADTCRRTEGMPEFESINKAFFKKKENLDKFQLAIQEGTLLSDHNIRIEQLDRLRIGEIKDLWDALNSHHLAKSTHFKNHFFSFTFDERFSKLQKKKNLVIFIALQGDRKCGYCVASVDDNVGEVDSIYVMEAQRGASIGIVLFLKAIDWLHDRDCWLINVAIAEGNEDVISFYERFGFKRRYTVLQKRFPLSE